jgi:hypothetical protein
MTLRLHLCLLVAVLAAAAPSPGQDMRGAPAEGSAQRLSHVPVPGGISPELADRFFEEHLQQAKTAADLEQVLADLASNPDKYSIDRPDDQRALRQAIQNARGQPEKLLEDPRVREIIRAAADPSGKSTDLTPEARKRLEEFASRYLAPGEFRPPDAAQPGETPKGPPNDPMKPPAAAPPASGGQPLSPVLPPDQPPSGAANSPMKDGLRKLAENLADSPIAESPAFRRMVAQFDRVKTPDAPGAGDWERRLEQFGDRFSSLGQRLPNVHWPKWDFSRRQPAGRMPPPPVGEPATMTAETSQAVLVLVGAAAGAFLLWGVLRRRDRAPGRRGAGGWRLGPWPVRPEAVRTRDDLVRAFEYLALRLLGPAACHHNHRDIAAELGESGADRRTAADRLAGLYQQARYAPPDDALPDADLAAARADLSLLAGAAAA